MVETHPQHAQVSRNPIFGVGVGMVPAAQNPFAFGDSLVAELCRLSIAPCSRAFASGALGATSGMLQAGTATRLCLAPRTLPERKEMRFTSAGRNTRETTVMTMVMKPLYCWHCYFSIPIRFWMRRIVQPVIFRIVDIRPGLLSAQAGPMFPGSLPYSGKGPRGPPVMRD